MHTKLSAVIKSKLHKKLNRGRLDDPPIIENIEERINEKLNNINREDFKNIWDQYIQGINKKPQKR